MSHRGSLLTLCESVEALGFSPPHWIRGDPMLSHGIRCQGPGAEKPRAVRVGGVNTRPTTVLTLCRSSQRDSPDAQCGRYPSPNILPVLRFPGLLPSPGLCLDLRETSAKWKSVESGVWQMWIQTLSPALLAVWLGQTVLSGQRSLHL